jgi:hypothetical protein
MRHRTLRRLAKQGEYLNAAASDRPFVGVADSDEIAVGLEPFN